jgi:transcriptional regulator with XRE-family HTH domain
MREGIRSGTEVDVRIGRRLRALRLQHGLTLRAVAKGAGVSIGALSQIERGLTPLRARFLRPLARALKIEPSQLKADNDEVSNDLYVIRGERRHSATMREGITKVLLSPPGSGLTGLLVKVKPNAGAGHPPNRHAGHECGLVLRGGLEITIDKITYHLRKGDSFAFKSTLPHAFRNLGRATCEVVWINTVKLRSP